MEKISCIICAYNEEERIGGVLEAVKNHPLIDEVIVVDDGSTDGTKKVIQSYSASYPKIRAITYSVNKGKSGAIVTGVFQARNKLIMLIDADLVGLTAENIASLAMPVLSSKADMSISSRKNGLLLDILTRFIGLDFISGERVFQKSLIESKLETIAKLPSFGFESYMNKLIIEKQLRIGVVYWKNVVNPDKSFKMGFWKGIATDFHMMRQILKVISLREVAYQNYKLRSLASPRQD